MAQISTPQGVTLEYETAGSPADPPLLLVMGFGAQLMSTTGEPEYGQSTPEAVQGLLTPAPADRAGYVEAAESGAGLAGACMELGLIDEWHLFVSPVVLGAGTPYFPILDERLNLELVETKTFGSRVVYLRYRVSPAR